MSNNKAFEILGISPNADVYTPQSPGSKITPSTCLAFIYGYEFPSAPIASSAPEPQLNYTSTRAALPAGLHRPPLPLRVSTLPEVVSYYEPPAPGEAPRLQAQNSSSALRSHFSRQILSHNPTDNPVPSPGPDMKLSVSRTNPSARPLRTGISDNLTALSAVSTTENNQPTLRLNKKSSKLSFGLTSRPSRSNLFCARPDEDALPVVPTRPRNSTAESMFSKKDGRTKKGLKAMLSFDTIRSFSSKASTKQFEPVLAKKPKTVQKRHPNRPESLVTGQAAGPGKVEVIRESLQRQASVEEWMSKRKSSSGTLLDRSGRSSYNDTPVKHVVEPIKRAESSEMAQRPRTSVLTALHISSYDNTPKVFPARLVERSARSSIDSSNSDDIIICNAELASVLSAGRPKTVHQKRNSSSLTNSASQSPTSPTTSLLVKSDDAYAVVSIAASTAPSSPNFSSTSWLRSSSASSVSSLSTAPPDESTLAGATPVKTSAITPPILNHHVAIDDIPASHSTIPTIDNVPASHPTLPTTIVISRTSTPTPQDTLTNLALTPGEATLITSIRRKRASMILSNSRPASMAFSAVPTSDTHQLHNRSASLSAPSVPIAATTSTPPNLLHLQPRRANTLPTSRRFPESSHETGSAQCVSDSEAPMEGRGILEARPALSTPSSEEAGRWVRRVERFSLPVRTSSVGKAERGRGRGRVWLV